MSKIKIKVGTNRKKLHEQRSRLILSLEERRLIKEHNLTEEQVKRLIEEGKWDDFKSWAKKKGKAASDKIKGAAKSAGEKAGGMIDKAKRLAKGAAEIGFGGDQATNLGGEETIDIDKRTAKKAEGEAGIKKNLAAVNYAPLNDLFKNLLASGWPNFSGKGKGKQKAKQAEPDEKVNEALFGHSEEFKKGVEQIKSVYEKIKSDFESGEKSEQALKDANNRIAVLRALVIYFQDYVLADQGSYLNEQEEEQIGAKKGAVSKNYDSVYSMKLPFGLVAAGAMMAASGFKLADTDWGDDFLKQAKDMPDAKPEELAGKMSEIAAKDIGIKMKGGFTYGLQGTTGVDLSPEAPATNFLDPKIQELLNPKLSNQYMKNPEDAQKVFDELLTKPEQLKGKTVANIMGLSTKLHGRTVDNPLAVNMGEFKASVLDKIAGKAADTVTGLAKKGGIKAVKKLAIGAVGAKVLVGLGVGAVGGGLASAAMRLKGKYLGSKMKTLKGLVDSFDDISMSGEPVDSGEAGADTGVAAAAAGGGTGGSGAAAGGGGTGGSGAVGGVDSGARGGAGGATSGRTGGEGGETVHVFRRGPHSGTGDKTSLSQQLMGAGLPNWAVHALTKHAKKELEANGFTVKEDVADPLSFVVTEEVPSPVDFGDRTRDEISKYFDSIKDEEEEEEDTRAEPDTADRMAQRFSDEEETRAITRAGGSSAPSSDDAAATRAMGTGKAVGKMPHEKGAPNTADTAPQDIGAVQKGTFKISTLRKLLGRPPSGQEPLDNDKIRAAQKIVRNYVGSYLKNAGVKIRESKQLVEKKELLSESMKNRWKTIAGIR